MLEANLEALPLSLLQKQIDEDQKRRSEEHVKEVARFSAELRTGDGRLNLYLGGDSWFDYPLSKDVEGWIRRDGNPNPINNNQAHHGNTAVGCLGVKAQKDLIRNIGGGHGNYDALLFSAGGNDLAGDQFVLWVVGYVAGLSPTHGIDRQRLRNVIGVIKAAYEDLIQIRNEHSPSSRIFLHGYDFPLTLGKGVCGQGPWLKPSLAFKGWVNDALGIEVVKEMLLEFDKVLVQLEHDHRDVFYVRAQGTLQHATDWANELHPTENGFRQIAGKFIATMRQHFPRRI